MSEYKLNNNSARLNDMSSFEDKIKKHQMRLYLVGVVMILGSLGIFGYKKYTEIQGNKAQEDIFDAVFAFEKGDYETAIVGTDDFLGLEEVSKKYSSNKVAKLINLYLGISYMNTRKYTEAINALTIAISIEDKILSARACGLIGDCYTELDDSVKAIDFFNKAANMNVSKETSPIYLVKIEMVYENSGDIDKALAMYKEIQDNYKDYRSEFIEKNIYRLKS